MSLEERIAMIRILAEKGLTKKEIAAEISQSYHYVHNLAREEDIEIKKAKRGRKIDTQKVEVIRELAEQGLTKEEIASKMGFTYQTVVYYASKEEIEIKKRKRSDTVKIIEELAKQNLTREEVASRAGLNYCYVSSIVKEEEIETKTAKKGKCKMNEKEEAKIRSLIKQGKKLEEIAEELEVTREGLRLHVIGMGIYADYKQAKEKPLEKIRYLAQQGYTIMQIISETGFGYERIKKYAKRENVEIKRYENREVITERIEVIKKLAEKGLTKTQIAQEMGMHYNTILKYAQKEGIEVRDNRKKDN